jgi:murein L,D-transpeptidase YcbB/YkuD
MLLLAPLAFSSTYLIEESVEVDDFVSPKTTSSPVDERAIATDVVVVEGKQFDNLQAAAQFYQQLAKSGKWQAIDSGPLLQLGDYHPQVTELKNLLYLYGDLDEASAKLEPVDLFDLSLHKAVSLFQKRHGAKTDGIFGPETRRLINISPLQRLEQLSLNHHRQQQLQSILRSQPMLDSYYLQVNIPEYRLRLYRGSDVILDMKTIIGRRSRQTPTFSSEVKTLVVNPFWNVPRSIAYRDILPRWKEDKDYLSRNHLKVVAGWSLPRLFVPDEEIDLGKMYRGKEYHRLLQPPGESNTLGRLKFQLSAGNSIYLHDTKSPYLFESQQRAMSSGCIRLEQPRKLARLLLQHSNHWQPQRLESLFADMETRRIRLENPIPIHITYWTSWLDEQGILHFADDLYHRDPVDFAEIRAELPQLALQVN